MQIMSFERKKKISRNKSIVDAAECGSNERNTREINEHTHRFALFSLFALQPGIALSTGGESCEMECLR